MVLRELRDFFLGCPLFLGKRVNVNFLGHNEGDISIEPKGDFSVIKKYCDGKKVYSQDFCISIRCGFDANVELNLSDSAFLESVALWIGNQNKKGILPSLKDGLSAVSIAVTRMPHIYDSSVQGATMRLEFSLTYREN